MPRDPTSLDFDISTQVFFDHVTPRLLSSGDLPVKETRQLSF